MNKQLAEFFAERYVPGSVGLVGATDLPGKLIREAQAALTPDGRPSRWSHCFVLGDKRDDGRDDGSVYIYESDLQASVKDWQVKNGVMESRLVKWCRDDIEHACVVGMDLGAEDRAAIVRKALEYAYDETHLKYPVGELFGSLWAIITRSLSKKNIFDDEYAVQCSTFVRMCYRHIDKDPLGADTHLTQTSPEALYQSQRFSVREEWPR